MKPTPTTDGTFSRASVPVSAPLGALVGAVALSAALAAALPAEFSRMGTAEAERALNFSVLVRDLALMFMVAGAGLLVALGNAFVPRALGATETVLPIFNKTVLSASAALTLIVMAGVSVLHLPGARSLAGVDFDHPGDAGVLVVLHALAAAHVLGLAMLIVTVLDGRSTDTALHRTPLFIWSFLAAAALLLSALPITVAGVWAAPREGADDIGAGLPLFCVAVQPLLVAMVLPLFGAASDQIGALYRRRCTVQRTIAHGYLGCALVFFVVWVESFYGQPVEPPGVPLATALLAVPLALFLVDVGSAVASCRKKPKKGG